jgi:hypothetical protein
MAKLTATGQQIVDQLQGLADELGHIPSQAEFEASELSKTLPLWRINSLLHGFDKACKHLIDPVERDLTPEQAVKFVNDWSLKEKELFTKTAWNRSIKAGAGLPSFERVVEASGFTENRLQFIGHETLVNAGYEPTGSARTRYELAKPEGAETAKARTKAASLKGVRTTHEDDHYVNQLLAEEAKARREAGLRQGKVQTDADRKAAENFLGL